VVSVNSVKTTSDGTPVVQVYDPDGRVRTVILDESISFDVSQLERLTKTEGNITVQRALALGNYPDSLQVNSKGDVVVSSMSLNSHSATKYAALIARHTEAEVNHAVNCYLQDGVDALVENHPDFDLADLGNLMVVVGNLDSGPLYHDLQHVFGSTDGWHNIAEGYSFSEVGETAGHASVFDMHYTYGITSNDINASLDAKGQVQLKLTDAGAQKINGAIDEAWSQRYDKGQNGFFGASFRNCEVRTNRVLDMMQDAGQLGAESNLTVAEQANRVMKSLYKDGQFNSFATNDPVFDKIDKQVVESLSALQRGEIDSDAAAVEIAEVIADAQVDSILKTMTKDQFRERAIRSVGLSVGLEMVTEGRVRLGSGNDMLINEVVSTGNALEVDYILDITDQLRQGLNH
jgi:hypothetical protein